MNECPICGQTLFGDVVVCPFCNESIDSTDAPSTLPDDAPEFDYVIEQIGSWSQVKHEIVDKYAKAYMTVMASQPAIKRAVYIDAFAGTGLAEDRHSGEIVSGSAARAIGVEPPFTEIHLVERDPARVASLNRLAADDPRVRVHHGDAVQVLHSAILRRCEYRDYARALCLLDPYGLSVPWSLLETIGHMRSVEIFFNFMVVGLNRNVLWKRAERVPESRKQLLDAVWGDRTWTDAFYERKPDLFGERTVKASNEAVVEAFRKRLQTQAGFPYVPAPIPITNRRRAAIYYLFFATHNTTGDHIVRDIFAKYRR